MFRDFKDRELIEYAKKAQEGKTHGMKVIFEYACRALEERGYNPHFYNGTFTISKE